MAEMALKNEMSSGNYLETEKVSKLLLKFGIPCVISLVISALYNIVDQVFIGNSNVGAIGNTATSLVFPLIIIGLAFGLLLGDGTAAYMSLCMGKKENDKVASAVGTSLVVAIIISAVYMLAICPFLDDVLVKLGARTAESLAASKEYAIWILVGMPFFILLNALNPVVRADGAPKTAMISNLSGCILNIILDAIFIFPLNMGLTGAALATTIGIVVSFLIAFLHLFKSNSFKLKARDFIPDFKKLVFILKLGFSSFLTQISVVIITIVSMNMLAKYGAVSKYGANDPQAIIGVIMKVFSIVVNIAVGIAAGAQPIFGYNYGAERYDRVKQLLKMVMGSVVVVGIIATFLFQCFPQPIVGIFGTNSTNPELYIEFGNKALRIYLLLILFTVIQKASSIFLQALGSAGKATFLSLVRDVISFVPLTIILPMSMGLDGILWSAPAADIFGIVFSIIFITIEVNKMNRRAAGEKLQGSEFVLHESQPGLIVAISREHGAGGRQVGKILAEMMNVPFYDKEMTYMAAKKSGLSEKYIEDVNAGNAGRIHEVYLSLDPTDIARMAQQDVLEEIADKGSCVIVGRAADYVLKDRPILRVFVYAPEDYRKKQIQEKYNDSEKEAAQNLRKSDRRRAGYYESITGQKWGDYRNYDLLVNGSIGAQETAKVIAEYIQEIGK